MEAQSLAGHKASTPVVPLPVEPHPAGAHDSSAERIPDAVQQLMINGFFDEEEGRDLRAEQARVAAAVGFAPTPVAGAPTVIFGVETCGVAGTSMSPCEDGAPALSHATGVVGDVHDPATGAMGPRQLLQSNPSVAAASQPATGVNQETAPRADSNRHGRGRDDSSGCHGGHRTRRATAVEPAFEVSTLMPYTQYAQSTEAFVSLWMLSVVARWPQAVASTKRRRPNADGADCSGDAENSTEGTNATAKTWMTRIRTACAFENFLGRTVCIHLGEAQPADAENERGVRKFFTCMTPFTKLTIICFLKCRRAGYSIAGSDQHPSATTLKNYICGLVYRLSSYNPSDCRPLEISSAPMARDAEARFVAAQCLRICKCQTLEGRRCTLEEDVQKKRAESRGKRQVEGSGAVWDSKSTREEGTSSSSTLLSRSGRAETTRLGDGCLHSTGVHRTCHRRTLTEDQLETLLSS